jgi:hypothetical protein
MSTDVYERFSSQIASELESGASSANVKGVSHAAA